MILIFGGTTEGRIVSSVLDESGTVIYTEQVPEVGQEPDYDAAVAALS